MCPLIRHSKFSPLSLHWDMTMVLICSSMPLKENSSLRSTSRPDSMRLMSRMSLISPSRCRALSPIFSRYSRVWGRRVSSFRARLFRPMMAFMGVRISWLMLDRKAVLALLACSAAASASASARFLASASRISASMTVKPTPTAWTMWSSRSAGWRTPAMRSIS